MMKTTQSKKQQFQATALRDAKEKSVLVEVKFLKIHRLYQKRYFVHRKMLVHTQIQVVSGDKVIIQAGKKISKRKAWEVVKVIK